MDAEMTADGLMGDFSLRVPLAKAQAGDAAAFEQLVRSYDRSVLRIAYRITGNEDDAREICQDVFLQLHRQLRKLDASRDPGPWIYRVAVNRANDYLRSRRVHEELEDRPSGVVDPERQAAARQLERMLARALAGLPEKERSAVLLRDVAGLETRAVAEILGSSETTVRSQISSARGKLRVALEKAQKGTR